MHPKVSKIGFWDRIIIWLDQTRLRLFRKEWTPDCKEGEFCCIVCGRVHRHLMFFDNPQGMNKLRGRKTAKKLYTFHFCSSRCANEYSKYAPMQLFAFNKMNEHLKSGFWKREGLEYLAWKKKQEKNEEKGIPRLTLEELRFFGQNGFVLIDARGKLPEMVVMAQPYAISQGIPKKFWNNSVIDFQGRKVFVRVI